MSLSDPRSITLLPPGHFANPSDAEWTLPDIQEVALAWQVWDANTRGHVEWLVGQAAGAGAVVLKMGETPIATVRLTDFVFSCAAGPWADTDPWALVRLERVVSPGEWDLTPWRGVVPGEVFYVWRRGDPFSRGSRCFDVLPLALTWRQLDEAWDVGEIHIHDP